LKRIMKRIILGTGTALASAAVALALISTAWGHAHVDTSSPSKGQVLQSPPTQVVLTFVETIQKTAGSYGLDVTQDGGGSVVNGAPTIDPQNAAKLSVALQSNLTAGRYVVRWNNVSSVDGDAAEGAFSFYVGTAPSATDLQKDKDLEMIGQEEMATAMPETTPMAESTSMAGGAAMGAALPRTGTGSGGERGATPWLAIAGIVAAAGLGTTLAARKLRRS